MHAPSSPESQSKEWGNWAALRLVSANTAAVSTVLVRPVRDQRLSVPQSPEGFKSVSAISEKAEYAHNGKWRGKNVGIL